MNGYQLYKRHTLEELKQMIDDVKNDPQNINERWKQGFSINIYTKPALKKLDAIGWAIAYHLQDAREKKKQDERS